MTSSFHRKTGKDKKQKKENRPARSQRTSRDMVCLFLPYSTEQKDETNSTFRNTARDVQLAESSSSARTRRWYFWSSSSGCAHIEQSVGSQTREVGVFQPESIPSLSLSRPPSFGIQRVWSGSPSSTPHCFPAIFELLEPTFRMNTSM